MKKDPRKVKHMFNSIAGTYDFLNHFFSFNIDASWRKTTVKKVQDLTPLKILDVAAGTMDLSRSFADHFRETEVVALDFAVDMLAGGLDKTNGRLITPVNGDALALPFKDNTFDIVSIAFGLRNLEDMDHGLREFNRVLKPGGTLLVLEFTPNKNFLFRFYSGVVMPFMGRLISGDKEAYSYLHNSVKAFPDADKLESMFVNAEFENTDYKKLTFSIAALHSGVKKRT